LVSALRFPFALSALCASAVFLLRSKPRERFTAERIQTVDVVMPVVNGPKLRLRCVMQPDDDLACLLERLALRRPKRRRALSVVAENVMGALSAK
jgi:hypothetical protein